LPIIKFRLSSKILILEKVLSAKVTAAQYIKALLIILVEILTKRIF
jgi:hypothetical protein